MRQLLYLVRQNLKRKRFHSWLMIGSIALACATIFMAVVLSKGIQNTLQTARERLGADIVAVPANATEEAESALISGNPTSFYMPAALEQKVRATPGVTQSCSQVFLRGLDAPCCVAQVALVGFDPEKDFTIGPWVLQNLPKPMQDNQIIVGAKVISAVVGTPTKAIGQRLIFMGKPFTVAMILEPTGLGTDYTVFVTMDTAYQLTQDSPLYPVPVKRDQISAILVKIADSEDPRAVAADMEKRVPEIRALTANQLTRFVGGQLESMVELLFIAGGVFCLLAVILAGSLFWLSVRRRMRELGLFRAMGAKQGTIFNLIILEAVCIAGTGGLAGVLLGLGVTCVGKNNLMELIGNMYTWPENSYFLTVSLSTLAVALATGILGGLYPARRISGMEPYEAIRKGE